MLEKLKNSKIDDKLFDECFEEVVADPRLYLNYQNYVIQTLANRNPLKAQELSLDEIGRQFVFFRRAHYMTGGYGGVVDENKREIFIELMERYCSLKDEETQKKLEKLDIVGSIYEFNNICHKNFILFSPNCHFTDDSVMTFAIAEALRKTQKKEFKGLESQAIVKMQKFGKLYPHAGYGLGFRKWLKVKRPQPYNSYGNGSAMRISPVVYYAKSLKQVKELTRAVTAVSHNHEEGLKGAEATAVAIWMALHKNSKEEIKKFIEENYYNLNFDYEQLKEHYYFNETCQNTVPQAIFCFLISESFEDCLRIGVSIGGDSDTLCAISSAIAEAFYGIPENIHDLALKYLDKRLLRLYNKYYRASTKINHDLKAATVKKESSL